MSLSKQIEKDLDWRTAELAELKKLTLSSKDNSAAYGTLLRALWVMLYAHYEGFCKFTISIFLDEIERTGKERKSFKDEIVIFSLEENFKTFRNHASAEQCYKYLTETFDELLKSQIQFRRNKRSEYQIKGESNLNAESLIEMCSCICISHEVIGKNQLKLNALVSRRNEIAHGKDHPIKSLSDYKEYEDAALDVMIELAITVIEALEKQSYLKTLL